mgnify:CR=1 FL=1
MLGFWVPFIGFVIIIGFVIWFIIGCVVWFIMFVFDIVSKRKPHAVPRLMTTHWFFNKNMFDRKGRTVSGARGCLGAGL